MADDAWFVEYITSCENIKANHTSGIPYLLPRRHVNQLATPSLNFGFIFLIRRVRQVREIHAGHTFEASSVRVCLG